MAILRDSPWLDNNSKDDMKTLSATELAVLRRFIRDVQSVVETDVEGVTLDLEDGLFACAQILDVVIVPEEDEEDPEFDEHKWSKEDE